MSISVMSKVWEHSYAEGVELLVLLAIADHASDDGSNAYPAISTLSRKARVSARTVQRAIRSLEARGELSVDFNGGRGGSNMYRVTVTPRQIVTPPANLTPVTESPRQIVGGDTGVTGGVSPVSPEPSFNHPSTPQPPASGGPKLDHCERHKHFRETCGSCVRARRARIRAERDAERKRTLDMLAEQKANAVPPPADWRTAGEAS